MFAGMRRVLHSTNSRSSTLLSVLLVYAVKDHLDARALSGRCVHCTIGIDS